MNEEDHGTVRIGILWRGDRSGDAPAPSPDRQLGELFAAFERLPVEIVLVPFADDEIDEVREEAFSCDGILVWVNPIQDGANRAQLDALLIEAVATGIYVSADPAVILKLGTKEVLFTTRDLGWGSDTELYRWHDDFAARFPERLADHGRLVLKQGRGNGGNGVWKVELVERGAKVRPDTTVCIQDARSRDGSSQLLALGAFIARCEEYFAWSGCLVDQEFQARLADGMIRCYSSHDQVVGFCHQWPRGLLDNRDDPPTPPAVVMEGPETPAYQVLRAQVEKEWVPQMKELLGMTTTELPVIWDADFLYGPRTDSGEDTYVLCEINVSAVWPFPPTASAAIAQAALECTIAAKAARSKPSA